MSDALALVDGIEFAVEPPQLLADRVRPFVPDPKDVLILAAALWVEADVLATGNHKDFGKLYGHSVAGCLVMRPRDALDLLMSQADS
jgi:hypothetical protein